MRNITLFVVGCVAALAVMGVIYSDNRRREQAELSRQQLAKAAAAIEEASLRRISYPKGSAHFLPLADGEKQAVKSILNVRHTMRFGSYVWDDAGVEPGAVQIRVDLAKQLLSVFRNGHEIGSAVILYGTDGKLTPVGKFHVKAMAADYHSRTYDAPMPYMLRLTDDGVAIHGSDVRNGSATHGCIGVPLEFARRLFDQAKLGDNVFILPETPPPASTPPAKPGSAALGR